MKDRPKTYIVEWEGPTSLEKRAFLVDAFTKASVRVLTKLDPPSGAYDHLLVSGEEDNVDQVCRDNNCRYAPLPRQLP